MFTTLGWCTCLTVTFLVAHPLGYTKPLFPDQELSRIRALNQAAADLAGSSPVGIEVAELTRQLRLVQHAMGKTTEAKPEEEQQASQLQTRLAEASRRLVVEVKS